MNLLKKISLILAVGIVATGCGGSKSNDGGSNDAKSGNVVRIAMWNPDQIAIMKEIEKKYEEKNPGVDIQIEETTFKDHFQKLETQAQGDVMPDLFTMNGPNFMKFVTCLLYTSPSPRDRG